ncbi:MAG TPA: futalosine hydrolase [Chitinophagaceae bacterium]|nr:futalosine hydrolase [Chitinophagaceae bacterium]
MQLLVCAATPKEIQPFLDHHLASRQSRNIDILITGIGLTATTYRLTRYLSLKRPDLVIQAGVAGGFSDQLPLGSVVAVRQETIADESVVELRQLRTLFALSLVPQNQYPYRRGWLVNPHKEYLKRTGLKAVRGISVNEITTRPRKIRFYRETFDPVVESMEGAALHFTCLMEQVPFLQLRSISNRVGERNKKKWNMQTSIQHLNQELIQLVETFKENEL